MGVLALLESFERVGGRLAIEGCQVEVQYPEAQREAVAQVLADLREHREEVIHLLQARIITQGIPEGAILVAPRYDSKPLMKIPNCWCCRTPYKLDHMQNRQEKLYAHLEPGCGCLNKPQALNCCGLCLDHCTCKRRDKEQEVAAS